MKDFNVIMRISLLYVNCISEVCVFEVKLVPIFWVGKD